MGGGREEIEGEGEKIKDQEGKSTSGIQPLSII